MKKASQLTRLFHGTGNYAKLISAISVNGDPVTWATKLFSALRISIALAVSGTFCRLSAACPSLNAFCFASSLAFSSFLFALCFHFPRDNACCLHIYAKCVALTGRMYRQNCAWS